jgi:Galactose oxidase, central domain
MGGSIPQYAPGYDGQPGVYGTLGTPSANNIPSSRFVATSWTDKSGNFWLFGGGALGGLMNDLWRFDPVAGEWTWMAGSAKPSPIGQYGTRGVEAPDNEPPARDGAIGWTDSQGNLWLFGGAAYPTTFNDLWEFDIVTGEWAWMNGSNTYPIDQYNDYEVAGVYGTQGTPSPKNMPGSRWNSVAWTDQSGNFWLFGGWGFDSARVGGSLNDLWKYDRSVGEWVWMRGSSALVAMDQSGDYGVPGVSGTLGSASPTNIPGGRYGAMSWSDGTGNLWLFGGYGYDTVGIAGELNDLWMLNPKTGIWSWMSGSDVVPQQCTWGINHCGQSGVYGSMGTPSATTTPGGRQSGVAWTTPNGDLWLFGGAGFDSIGVLGFLNDLWRFDPTSQQWEWVEGGSKLVPTGNAPGEGEWGVYGTLGIPDEGNTPGGRWELVSSVDRDGNLWLFGGADYDAIPNTGDLNDLWEFVLPKTFNVAASTNDLTVVSGGQGNVTLTVTPGNGFNAAVSFTCSQLSAGASCSFSPATVTPNVATASTTLTISTSKTAAARNASRPLLPELLLAALVGVFSFRRQRKVGHAMFLAAMTMVAMVMALGVVTACGGGSGGGTTAPPTPTVSTVIVRATSGSLQRTVTLTLTEN